MPTRLPSEEYTERLAAVRDRLADRPETAATFVDATSIAYLTGFHHVQTERPVVLAVTADRVAITVPRLEVERIEPNTRIDDVFHYFDYPDGDPVGVAASMLSELGADAVVGDAEGPPGVMGFEGPAFSEFVDVTVENWVGRMRWEKSDAEVDLIRESARWGNLAHRYLADFVAVDAHPATVSQRASLEASRAMLDTLGDEYVALVRGDGPAHAGFISGPQTALPHGHTANRRLERGDVLVTGATADVHGYSSELERTMFVGEVDDEDADYFEQMLEAQTIAIEALGPGVEIGYVDEQVADYFEEQGLSAYAQHHVGHNIGLGAHEPPYIDRGWGAHCVERDTRVDEDRVMQPGQVYTIEPGIYTEDAGYRHSDTVAITEDGTETLTYFPRDLESNVISVE